MPRRDIVSQVITASAKAVSINYCCPNACVQHCDSERALPVDTGPRDSDNKHSSYQLTVRATAREWTSCTKHLRDRTISVVLLLRNVSSRVHLCVDKKRSVPSENQGGASTPTARKGANYGKIEILRKRDAIRHCIFTKFGSATPSWSDTTITSILLWTATRDRVSVRTRKT